MTGGQPVDDYCLGIHANRYMQERVRRIAIVTDQPDKYPKDANFAPGVTINHRHDLQKNSRRTQVNPRDNSLDLWSAPPKSVVVANAVSWKIPTVVSSLTKPSVKVVAIAVKVQLFVRDAPRDRMGTQTGDWSIHV